MDRKQFLKKLGLGALAVTVAPKVIGDIKEAPLKVKEPKEELPKGWYSRTFRRKDKIGDEYPIYDTYTAEPDWDVHVSEDFVKAEQAWHDHVLREVFLKGYKG